MIAKSREPGSYITFLNQHDDNLTEKSKDTHSFEALMARIGIHKYQGKDENPIFRLRDKSKELVNAAKGVITLKEE